MSETSIKMRPGLRCQEHQILHGRLRADTKVYVDATRRLEFSKPDEFAEVWKSAELARRAFLDARKLLAAHIVEHKCER